MNLSLGALVRRIIPRKLIVTRTCPYCGSSVKLNCQAVTVSEVEQAMKEESR